MQLKRRSPLGLHERDTYRWKPLTRIFRRPVISKFRRCKYILPTKTKKYSNLHDKNVSQVPTPVVATSNNTEESTDRGKYAEESFTDINTNINLNTLSSSSSASSHSNHILCTSIYTGIEKEETTKRNRGSNDCFSCEWSTENDDDDDDDNENAENAATIFRQLSILKRGGYWKHLPREDQDLEGEQHESGEEEIVQVSIDAVSIPSSPFGGIDENKENVVQSHPNVRSNVTTPHEEDVDGDDSDDTSIETDEAAEDDCVNDSDSNPFDSSDGLLRGFYVHAITEDGWMCSNRSSKNETPNNNRTDNLFVNELGEEGEEKESRREIQQRSITSSSLLLLRLPKKVAALGKEGMHVQVVGLMKRRDNGAAEPCNHQNSSNGDIVIRSSSEQLYGTILF